jgi:hypothetical protein
MTGHLLAYRQRFRGWLENKARILISLKYSMKLWLPSGLAVTVVANHDTQPLRALEAPLDP